MPDPTLDDQLKLAQIEKTRAEATKLVTDAQVATKQARGNTWSEVIKIGGAVILGIGGAVAAYTQYEVAELKANIATEHEHQATRAAKEAADRLAQAQKAVDAATGAELEVLE